MQALEKRLEALEAQHADKDLKHNMLKQEIFQNHEKFQISIENSFKEFMQSIFIIGVFK